jgi:hypothetical protein
LSELLRDPRYVLPLAVLLFVIVISAAMGAGPSAVDSAVPDVRGRGLPFIPAPTPTPDYTNDYQRAIDLGTLREASLAYYRLNGYFPSTHDTVVPLCEGQADAGCILKQSARGVPIGDGEAPYYYVSDGTTYAIFIAKSDAPGDPALCPGALPPGLTDRPLMCMVVGAPVP